MKTRRIKIGLFAAIAALAFCLIGCSGSNGSSNEEVGQEEQIQTYNVGEAVETDIAKLTLDKASLAIAYGDALEIGSTAASPIEQKFFLPQEPNSDESGQEIAAKGHSFACIEYTIENLDRVAKFPSDIECLASVKLDGIEYESYSEGASDKINTEYGLFYNNMSGHFFTNFDKRKGEIIAPGETVVVRVVLDIPVEQKELSSPFDITFNLPTSSNESEAFTYTAN